MQQVLKDALIPIGGLTSGFPIKARWGEGGPWGSVWPENVEKPGDSPDGQSRSPIVAARRSRSSNSRKDLVTGPIPSFSALQNLLQEVRINRGSEMLDPLSRAVLGWRDDREPSRRGYVGHKN